MMVDQSNPSRLWPGDNTAKKIAMLEPID